MLAVSDTLLPLCAKTTLAVRILILSLEVLAAVISSLSLPFTSLYVNQESIIVLLTDMILSPALIPAFSAGEFGNTLLICGGIRGIVNLGSLLSIVRRLMFSGMLIVTFLPLRNTLTVLASAIARYMSASHPLNVLESVFSRMSPSLNPISLAC